MTIYTFLFPIDQLHPDSARKSAQIWCAPDRPKAWDDWFATGKLPDNNGDCATPIAKTAGSSARSIAISATPTLVFADGSMVPGALPPLEHELASAASDEARREAEAKQTASARRSRSAQQRATTLRVVAAQGDDMAILDFLKKQFIDIIEWTDDSRDTLSYPLSRRGQGDQARRAADRARIAGRAVRLSRPVRRHVRPGQVRRSITDNIPILSDLKGWKYGFGVPFKADVYYVITRLFTGNKWGTANPVMMRDQDFGIVRLRAYGTYDFQHHRSEAVPQGSRRHRRSFPARRIQRHHALAHRQRVLRGARAGEGAGARRRGALRRARRGAAAADQSADHRDKYGLEITSFIVENVSVPPEVEQAIDKRSSMAAVGNLNDYVKFQMAQGMAQGGSGGPGGVARRDGRRHGDGAADDEPGGRHHRAQSTPGVAAPCRAAARRLPARRPPELLTPAQVAQMLGVARIRRDGEPRSGDLKGKKIGTQWRVTRAAVDTFLHS